MERTGFVLEGGGMRGIYTAGVLDEMMDWGVRPDGFWACRQAPSTGRASFRPKGAKHPLHQAVLPQLALHEPAFPGVACRATCGPRLQLRGAGSYRLDPFDFDAF